MDLAHGRNKFNSLIAEGRLESEFGTRRVLLVKPQTFMNCSGQAVGKVLSFYKLLASTLVVIHDELGLPAGKFRVKDGGGNNGHNGLKSIDAHVGVDYRRLRLGIGHPGDKTKVNAYVLGNFSKTDSLWRDPLLCQIARFSDLLIAKDASTFMNEIQQALNKINHIHPVP